MLDVAGNADGSPAISLLALVPLPEEEGYDPDDYKDKGGYTDADTGFGACGDARGGFSLSRVCGEGWAREGG
jgi:hypothetical protein